MRIHHPIAIVGIGGIFPGASTPEQFWKIIEQGVSTARQVPDGRWPLSVQDLYDPSRNVTDKVYSLKGCYVEDFALEAEGFELESSLIQELDPVFHLALHAAREALQDAGLSAKARRTCGVMIGNIALPTETMSAITAEILGRAFEEKVLGTSHYSVQDATTHPINRHAVGLVAGLLTRAFGLGRGSYTVDGACAASLYAINYAVGELLSGRADVMLTGGIARPDSAFTQMGFSQLGALSPSGVCAPFDERNDGLVVGEGAGFFVLKRLDDAVRDGDHIYAMVRGIGLSNDRRGNLLAPDSEGQVRAMQTAYQSTGWRPLDIDLIECHATGTPVGDAVEFASLRTLWGEDGWQPGQCVIGGVKSNVGHLLTGAGAAGLMKIVLALKHTVLPPTANFSTPSSKIDLEHSPFTILKQAKVWERRRENTSRRAAVSAFGFGGINAHLLVEEWQAEQPTASRVYSNWNPPERQQPAIAIIGMAAHVGPWKSLRAFQERVLGGGDAVEPGEKQGGWGVEKSRWAVQSGLSASVFKGYFLDALFVPFGRFRIPPKELQESLPQQLLILQVAAMALEDAGWTFDDEKALRAGVYIGIGLDFNSTNFSYRWRIPEKARYWANTLNLGLDDDELTAWIESLRDAFCPPLTANRTVGALGGIVASRIAREFKIGGTGITFSSEENSGLQALNAAVRSLQQGDIDQAIVGAVDLSGDIRAVLTNAALEQEGQKGIIESQSKGDFPGEGAAAVIVKRLDDAIRDGDKIYAVVKGLGTASGSEAAAHQLALDAAWQEAGIAPETAQYFETPSLRSFYQHNMVGNVKTAIGYTGAASGLFSLVKTCLGLHQEIMNGGNISHNEVEDFSSVPERPQYWLRNRAEGPRRAGVSSCSVDGSWVHVVLEACEGTQNAASAVDLAQPLGARKEALFALEAESQHELSEKLEQLQHFIEARKEAHIERVAREWWTAHPITTTSSLGAAVLLRHHAELPDQVAILRQTMAEGEPTPISANRVFFRSQSVGPTGEVAFVFPGSGNHYPGMGREISAQWPEILRRQDQKNQYLQGQYIPELLWNAPSLESMNNFPREILLGQVAYSTLMTDVIRNFGVQPQAVIGYSLGESSAFFAMGVWNERDEMLRRVLESPLYTSELAGTFQAAANAWNLPEGQAAEWTIAALQVPVDEIRELLESEERVYLLIINTPESCVIGGDRQRVEKLVKQLGVSSHLLSGVSAAHCEIIKQVEQPYRALHYFRDTLAPQGIRFYSGGWGKAYPVTAESAADAILAQASGAIDFPAVVRQAYQDGVRTFIEIGPGNSCSNMIRRILSDQPHCAVSACASHYEDVSTILRLLGTLIAERVPVDLTALYGQETLVVAHQIPQKVESRKGIRISIGGDPFQVKLPEPKKEMPLESVENAAQEEEQTSRSELETFQEASATPESVNNVGNAPSWGVNGQADGETGVLEPGTSVSGNVVSEAGQQIAELVQGMSAAQTSKVQAQEAYLKLAKGLTQSYADQLAQQMSLLESVPETDISFWSQNLQASSPQPTTHNPQPVFMTREQCLEFAVGSIAKVLGPEFAEVDTYPTRVRLPDEPLMLVDRILAVEGEPNSLTKGRVITEHDILPDMWYLDCGRIPTCMAVESGQADLFLSAYLGIDRVTKGLAVYRLLDATVTFHAGLPRAGDVIRHDIHIDEFFRQDETYLFRFRFESTVNGKLFLTMTEGSAGFFTQTALDEGGGVVFTDMDRRPLPGKIDPDWRPLTPMTAESYSDEQVEALRRGDLAACFGEQFADLPLQHPCSLPGGRMKLVDRILSLDPTGGRYGLGQIRGEADIHPDDWFLTCHFSDDPVMPGTLMYECCLHTLRIFLMRMGWVGEQHEIAWEPVPGIAGQLKCRGQVIATTKKVVYEIALKEIGYRPEPYVICDAIMYADDLPAVRMIDMSLQLSGMTREKLEAIWGKEHRPSYSRKPAIFDAASILAFSNGKPSDAFGERYKVFDEERTIARLPGPPYQFLDRITAVEGEQWVMTAGKSAEAQYDVPPQAWYFGANRSADMPFSVVLEIVLQPCGWLAAYAGSALTSEIDLSFRNLGGEATQFASIAPNVGTLTTRVTLTAVSNSGGMIIQHYEYTLTNGSGEVLYQGTTYFGFFTKHSLANQVGLRDVDLYQLNAAEIERGETLPYPTDAPFPDAQLRMVDEIDLFVADGGPQSLGFIRGVKAVNPDEWFFKAHFYQDPVWPGSLGLEAFLQLLKVAAVKRWGWHPGNRFATMVPHYPHQWTYRGQVIPTDGRVTLQAIITAVDDTQRLLEAAGFLTVDGRIIYQMEHFTIQMS